MEYNEEMTKIYGTCIQQNNTVEPEWIWEDVDGNSLADIFNSSFLPECSKYLCTTNKMPVICHFCTFELLCND